MTLRGWLFDPSRPSKRPTVDVFCGDLFLGQATAGFARPDLKAAGFGDGNFQFLMKLPALPETRLKNVVVTVSRRPDIQITPEGALGSSRPQAGSPSELHDLFGPLVRSVAGETSWPSHKPRSNNRKLVASSSAFGVPLSAFAQHVALKFDWPASRAWTEDGFDSFLNWYVGEYAVAQSPKRVPWSEDEIAFWQETGSRPHYVNRAADRFARRARSRTRARAVYEWAVEDSHRLCVEDIFVGRELIARLRAVSFLDTWKQYPLSRFMRFFIKENSRLHGLGTRQADQRQAVYAAIMLYGLTAPHLLTYLPSRWLAEMLRTAPSGSSFERAVSKLTGQTSGLSANQYILLLKRRGFDIARQRWMNAEKNTGKSDNSGDVVFDVQLIGPFRRTLGLGESARRIAAALKQCAITVNLVDYDLGNASGEEDISLSLAPVAAARFTILHLNLEEIPEAIAWLPEHISSSYLVAFPYFELSAPSSAHRLGLQLVQEIWTASSFLRSVFLKSCEKTYVIGMPANMHLPKATPADQWAEISERLSFDNSFVFLTTADALSWVQRKNVLGVIDAFQKAFGPDTNVRLLIKTHNRLAVARADNGVWTRIVERVEADQRIDLIDETLDANAYRTLLSKVDCLVSLHRAEGLGLDLLDAMAIGTPVVATAYSGNSDFCDSSTCWPISFDLMAVEPQDYVFVEDGHVWAEPHLDEAVRALQQVYGDASERAARTDRARTLIAATHSLGAVSGRIAARLEALGMESSKL